MPPREFSYPPREGRRKFGEGGDRDPGVPTWRRERRIAQGRRALSTPPPPDEQPQKKRSPQQRPAGGRSLGMAKPLCATLSVLIGSLHEGQRGAQDATGRRMVLG